MSKLGTYIRSLRKEKGLTQSALAQMLHVTDKAVSKWERNLSYPDISLFPKLADILGVTVSDLLREGDDGSTSGLRQIVQMSHDIRTPVHIILGCADLVETYVDDPVKRKRYLEGIRESARYLLERYEQILKTARKNNELKREELEEYFRTETDGSDNGSHTFKGIRVLIAEDIELNREIASEMLRQTGAETEFAENGKTCLEMLQTAPDGYYDLILMDISMPEMDGVEATRRIRMLEQPEKAMIPIIAMTANVCERDRESAFEAGMNGFVEKPVNPDVLYQTIQTCLKNK